MTSPGPELWSSLQLAQRLLSNGQRREAFGVACKLAITDYERADWNDALGTLFTYCEDPERALRFFERAVDLMPTHPGYQYNLATAQRMLGFFPAAETTLDTVIALNPGDADAYYIRSDLRTQTPDKNHVRQLRHLLQSPLESAPKEIMLRFALGKELEDLERYDEAFQNFKRGCELERGRMRYSVSDDVATLDALIEYHDSSALSRHSSQESDKCIFVVGLPRTGTTLVERILGGHSKVIPIGESPAFAAETVRAIRTRFGRSFPKLELARRALEIDAHTLGGDYLHAASPPLAEDQRFLDKQPLNYLYLGLIRRALPSARLIVVVRDPLDTCFALYKTLFTGAYPFSYDFSDLANYYAAWVRLIRHWKSCIGEDLFVVNYEDLVKSPEPVTRALLQHCGLAWESGILDFHNQRAPVTSASAVQVRRPLYISSVGRWRSYAAHLTTLRQLLEQQNVPLRE